MLSAASADDAASEGPETVTLTLSSPSNASLGSPNPATLTILDDETPEPFDEVYRYNQIGNLIYKTGLGAYGYGATAGSCRSGTPASKPHAVISADGISYGYDCNGNLTSAGGQLTSWDAENRPSSISRVSGSETYTYDADGERVTRVHGSTTTVYLGGLWEEDLVSGATTVTRTLYMFNGVAVAQRERTLSSGLERRITLHGDHLGSVSVATGRNGSNQTIQISAQTFDPWGQVSSGGISQTTRNYTGQRLDSTGLLYYHARYYDPKLARFVSADTISPDYKNPQTRNRYSYVLNNPLSYTDPTGHCAEGLDNTLAGCGQYLNLHGWNLSLADWTYDQLKTVADSLYDLKKASGWSITDYRNTMTGSGWSVIYV